VGEDMLGMELYKSSGKNLKVLCLGAHCDDIEIGCGGTLLSLLENHRNTEVYWVVFSSDFHRAKEARSSANIFLSHAGRKIIKINKYRNGYFPYIGGEIKNYFEEIKGEISPDIIFTHYRKDLHQDHRIISELTWNTFRNNFILEYEIPKYDGDFGTPNCYVPLELNLCRNKIKYILLSFTSQSKKHWFKKDLFISIMRIRGMECASSTNYAEAFYCRKMVLKYKNLSKRA
jgi:LmbE family N-acetylglucosaminyl deacetylase